MAENSNKEEFVVEEPQAIEEKPEPKTVADVTAGAKRELVKAEKKEQTLPDFMKMSE